jgi:hypothetical protein
MAYPISLHSTRRRREDVDAADWLAQQQEEAADPDLGPP